MFHFTRIVYVLLLFAFAEISAQSSFPNTVFYQIYPRGYYDSNGDGLGDFNGITEKLDYIDDLGAGALWIMPMFKSNTPHKYFSTDHMLVDPEYGTNADLKNLVDEAHRRGIKVLIDFSINHVNNDNEWFLHSVENGRNSPYYSYFHWVEERDDYNPETYTSEGRFEPDFKSNYKSATNSKGDKVSYYYARFMDAPDLNYDNQNVRDFFLEAGRYWVGEIGIDGLRLDAARHIYDVESNGGAEPGSRNFKWWKTFCDEMHKINPEVFLLGEIWSSPEHAASYLATGMDATFNFGFSASILESVKEETNVGLTEEYLNQTEIRNLYSDSFGDATFLINHDMKRLLNELDFEEEKVKLAVALLMTYPGSPFIYYGEELGYEADWHLLWLPMLWDEWGNDPGQTSWILGDSTIMNSYLTVQYDRKRIDHFQPLSVQMKDDNSWFHYYRRLMRLRKQSDALSNGDLKRSELSNNHIVSFIRESAKESLLVIHNPTVDSQKISFPLIYESYDDILYMNGNVKLTKQGASLPAFSTVILR